MFQSDANCMYLISETAFVFLLHMIKVYSFLHRMASCRKRKLETCKNSQTLPCVPHVTFEDGLERVDNITRSILESKSFEDAMNSAHRKKVFLYTDNGGHCYHQFWCFQTPSVWKHHMFLNTAV